MRTNTAHCKFCGKKYEVKSEWLPWAMLDFILESKHFFHAVIHHSKECGFVKLFKAFVKIFIWRFLKGVLSLVIIFLAIILYPLYALLRLLYE